MLTLNTFIGNATNNFDQMDINFSFSLKQPFNLVDTPLIRVEKDNNLTNEKVLITEQGIYYRSLFFFGSTQFIPIEKGMDARSSDNFKNALTTLFWFMLPSLFFWSIILFAIYFIIVIFVTFILALVFSWIFQISLGWSRILKSAIFASTILIVLQLVLMPFYRSILLPLIAYWVLLLIVILLLKDELQPHGKSNIFVDHSSGKHKDGFSKSPRQDSFDVDEHGNVKGNRKKRSADEENEGYVEL